METKKLNKFDVKDFIKENSGKPRLQSLRLPRDLSLGGSKLPKKVYKPNLNVIRHKEKTKAVLKRDKRSRENNHQSQNVQKQRFLQSTGVFSEGIGDLVNRIPEKRVSYVRDIEKLQINTNKTPPKPKRTEQAEQEISNYLHKYDESSDDDDCKDSSPTFAPINWDAQDLSSGLIKGEVKDEITDSANILQRHDTNQEVSNSSPVVTLWQLPDSLGIKQKSDKKLVDCRLTDLPEGKIGKLCVRRSGKIDVYIGNVQYELESAELETFSEEIVSLNAENAEESAATVITKIDNRFLLNPVWEYLLR